MKDERVISKDVLERRDIGGHCEGNQVIEVTIEYRKLARPRGYYLCVETYRELKSSTMHELFTAPSSRVLLQPCNAFNAKTFEKVTASPDLITAQVEFVKAAYWAARKIEQDREAGKTRHRESLAIADDANREMGLHEGEDWGDK